jgi:hypothetical protein
MEIIPIGLRKANSFVDQFHRHNHHTRGHKFSIGLVEGADLIGVAIAGRPVARKLDDGRTLEILRVCIKPGSPKGANSMLYARCKRIGQIMGYKRIITYTLKTESQSSLKAVGAHIDGETEARSWSRRNRKRDEQNIYKVEKIRWNLHDLTESDAL